MVNLGYWLHLQIKTMKHIRLYILLCCVCCSTFYFSQTVPGVLSSNATVCANSNNGILTLSTYTGSVIRWEYSPNGVSLWTTIANTSATYNYVNLPQTTYFRAIVQAIGYTALASTTVVITTDNPSIGGIASVLSATECIGNTVKMTVSSYSGTILNWQQSTNGGVLWNTIPSSNDSITKLFNNITVNTLFRATIKRGVCPIKVSDSVKVTVAPLSVGGVATSNATVCAGTNANTINVSGQVGTITRWESSPSGLGPWSTIANTTTSLNFSNLVSNTYYRAIAKSANCAEAPSSNVFIKVDNLSNGGFINGTQNVCSTLNNGVLNLNGNNGSILQWEYSINGGTSWITTPVNTSTYNFSNLTQNTLYKVQVLNGTCPPVYSNTLLVSINPLPVVNFTFTQGCQGKPMSFTNTSVGSNIYSWDFKDGNNANVANPSNTFLNSGSYLVKLTATSTNGCIDSVKKNVVVYAKPNVSFVALDSACGFKQVVFTNNSNIVSGSITNYVWNFGDNTLTSSLINPTHTYSFTNAYIIKLVATSNNGCKDSASKQITIFPKPKAGFTTNNVCKKTPASFINTSFINGGGMFYTWNFGDTQSSSLTSPTHSYVAAGNYNVSLSIISNHGCQDTIIKPIRINEQPNLTINAANVCLSKTTNFTQTVTPAVSGYTLNWNLGNSFFLTGNAPTYTYSAPGNYPVVATLTTDSGCVSTFAKIITIYPLATVAFNFNNVCNADSASMTNLSSITSGSISYSWNFGNTFTSTAANPKIKYTSAGAYPIKLVVTTNNGCKDSLTKPISIFDSPITNYNFSNSCDGNPITFTNVSTVNSGVIANNNWSFSDNTNSTLFNPIKQFLTFGTYTVNLETTSSNGCKSNLTKTVSVYEGAVANFSFVNKCLNIGLPFSNSTQLGNGTFNSFWNFGDSTSATVNSPTHSYQFAGTKKVWLKVITNNGCVDSISKFVQVYSIPIVNAGKDTTISRGYGVPLKATGAASYAWSPGIGLSNPTISNPIANPEQTTTYIVEGTSANGCSNSDTVVVTINDNFLVVPYNIVTPNGNAKNDVWYVKNIESYPNNKVLIMDEWGVVIYEKTSYNNTWDGRNKRGEILPDGTYFYILTFTENPKVYKGFITLLRNN
jgi:gliding motility-associated-like protein